MSILSWRSSSVVAPAHRARVEEAEPAEDAGQQRLATEEQVRGDVEVVGEREILVDGLDAERRAPRAAIASETALPSIRISPLVGLQRRRRGS